MTAIGLIVDFLFIEKSYELTVFAWKFIHITESFYSLMVMEFYFQNGISN